MLAIFLHLGNNSIWDDIDNYFLRIKETKYDLFINMMNDDEKLKNKIINKYPNTVFFNFDNKGCDIGPFILFLKYIINNNLKYEWIMKLHSKTDNNWRNRMFESLLPNDFDFFYKNKLTQIGNFYSAYNFMYDYFNINYDIEYSKLFNLDLIYDWKKAEEKYIELKQMNPIEKNIYNNNHDLDKTVLPDIDLELYEYLFNNYKKNHNIISGGDKFYILKIIKNLKKNSKLNYSPGTCFIGKYSILEKYFKNIDIDKLYKLLEEEKPDDNLIQSRTHSLERVLCFLYQI